MTSSAQKPWERGRGKTRKIVKRRRRRQNEDREETGMEEMHATGALTREEREREREKREKGQGGEIGEKTTYINDMMDGGRGLSTIPNRHRNAQELQGDCPGSWGQGGRRRGARGARI